MFPLQGDTHLEEAVGHAAFGTRIFHAVQAVSDSSPGRGTAALDADLSGVFDALETEYGVDDAADVAVPAGEDGEAGATDVEQGAVGFVAEYDGEAGGERGDAVALAVFGGDGLSGGLEREHGVLPVGEDFDDGRRLLQEFLFVLEQYEKVMAGFGGQVFVVVFLEGGGEDVVAGADDLGGAEDASPGGIGDLQEDVAVDGECHCCSRPHTPVKSETHALFIRPFVSGG